MAKVTEFSFTYKGKKYGLDIDFDDAAIMDNKIAFDLVAKRSGGNAPDLSVDARVEIDPEEEGITISVQGETFFEGHIFETENRFEEILSRLPPELFGDPITGCATRAGVSAIVGQAITCARGLQENGVLRVLSEYLKCMANNFSSISTTAMYRAFRCIADAT